MGQRKYSGGNVLKKIQRNRRRGKKNVMEKGDSFLIGFIGIFLN